MKKFLQKYTHHKISNKNHAFTKERIVIEEKYVLLPILWWVFFWRIFFSCYKINFFIYYWAGMKLSLLNSNCTSFERFYLDNRHHLTTG